MIKNLSSIFILAFLVVSHASVTAEERPIVLSVTGNQGTRVAPGETINIYVRAEATIDGNFSLEIKPERPPFASNWDTKSTFCKTGCVLTDTLTLSPTSIDCGRFNFTIVAQLNGPDGFSEIKHHVTIEVAPKMIQEPPFTGGTSNLICWDGCDALQEELVFFPRLGQSNQSLFRTTRADVTAAQRCEVVEGLRHGVRYGYYTESTVQMDGKFVVLKSDTTFSTQDIVAPPDVSLHDFTVSSQGDVRLRWMHLPDETGVIEKYVVHRLDQNNSVSFTVVDTIPFFPVKVSSPRSYFPVAAKLGEALYLDSDELLTQLPDVIKGTTLIRTAIADRWNESEDFLRIWLESPAELFVAIDKRGTDIPAWLGRDFRTINKDIRTNNDTRLRIFKSRRVFAAGEVILGGNFAAGTDVVHIQPSMYSVFIKPTDRVFPYEQGDFITYTDPLGEENDLQTFRYQIEAIDAAGNISNGITSGPVILDLNGHCKPIITAWFVAQGPNGKYFSRGTRNKITIQDPGTLAQCVGFRDSDSLRFQAARGGVDLLGTQPPGDDEGFFFDSGWLSTDDLPESFSYEFDLLPADLGPNFVNGQDYFYRVRAKDVYGNLSAWSDTVSAIQDFFPPTDISGLTATTDVFASEDDGCIRLDWRAAVDLVSGVGSYVIYRSSDGGGTFAAMDEIDSRQTSFCDTLSNIESNIVFRYKVLARDRVGNSIALGESSQEVSLRALVGPRIELDIEETFDCPTGLIGVNRDTVAIQWLNFDATDVVRYEARVIGPGQMLTFKTIESPGATRADCPIAGGDGVYEIRVRAFYNTGEVTIFSNAVVVRKKTRLQGVEELVAVQDQGSSGDILLSWTHPDGNEIFEFQIFTWPEGEPRPAEPTVVLPGDNLQWTHSFDQGSVAAYQCNNYLVKARDCFNLTSTEDPIATQYSNRAPIFDRTQIEINRNDITICWKRPVPRFKSDDSFTAEVFVYQDSVTAAPFFRGEVFNKTCFTFFDVPPMHNYIFQVRETILDDLQQSCSETFVSSLSDPLIIPLDNLPPSVSFDAQALPVLPEESQGKVFLSWQGFSSLVVENFVVKWTTVETPTVTDSLVLAVVDTVLVEGLDIDKTYEFTVVAIDFLKQRSVANDIETVSFKPRWVFTPKPQRLMPSCFRDSVTVELDWVDDNLIPLDSTLGADSVFVELSIDPAFQFIKSSRGFKASRSFTFHKDEDYPFVNRQNDNLYVRVRAKDSFNHLSPWSTAYSALGSLSGTFDDAAPDPVTTFIDSTKAPDFMGTNRVNVHLSWADVSDNCSGTWFYEIKRGNSVIAHDTSRAPIHLFVDRGVAIDDQFLDLEWRVNAVDSAGNRQALANPIRIPFQINAPDSGGCKNDSTFCWSAATTSVPGLEVSYFVEGARFEELLGNPTTNVLAGPLTARCYPFDVPWKQIHWRVKARSGNFESAWSDIFFCQLSVNSSVTTVDSPPSDLVPDNFALRQNYPNPFNPSTTIEYAIPRSDGQTVQVLIELFNVTGQKIRTLVNSDRPPGEYKIVWDGRDDHGWAVSSGVYVYRIRAKNFVASQKLILLK